MYTHVRNISSENTVEQGNMWGWKWRSNHTNAGQTRSQNGQVSQDTIL